MKYPNLLRRYLATLIDIAVVWFIVFFAVQIQLLTQSTAAMVAVIVLIVFSYEPLLTAYLCTVGQGIMRIRVRTYGTFMRISYVAACIRLVVKYVLGGISVLTIPADRERRAIHDAVSQSIVIDASAAGVAEPSPTA